MRAPAEFEKLLDLMAHLRGAEGCPWDREQTMSSLRPFILEEAYELVEAIQTADPAHVREELGDLLLEVVFVTQIAREEGLFSMAEVARGIHDKLVRRHPHVFADEGEKEKDPERALARWDDIKKQEKPHRESLLDGVARSLPALARAQKLASRAASGGFDWSSSADVRRKLDEELEELDGAITSRDQGAIEEELGDLLFVVVNLARHLSLDAETALSRANEKFSRRFRHIEQELAKQDRTVNDAKMDELEALWQEAKQQRD